MIKRLIFILILAPVFYTLGCENNGSTSHLGVLVNNSGHHVELLPYTDGVIKESAKVSLNIGDEFRGEVFVMEGILGPGTPLNFGYLADTDSIIVLFDDSIKTVHFRDTIGFSTTSYLTRKSNRCLYSPDSYYTEVKDISKKQRNIKETYTFTEEDYEYAITFGMKKVD